MFAFGKIYFGTVLCDINTVSEFCVHLCFCVCMHTTSIFKEQQVLDYQRCTALFSSVLSVLEMQGNLLLQEGVTQVDVFFDPLPKFLHIPTCLVIFSEI